MKWKRVGFILITILWFGVIFYASSRTSSESNGKSKEMIYNATKEIVRITNKMKITNVDLKNENWLKETTAYLNYPMRKIAHAMIYFILGVLCMIGFKNFSINLRKALILTIAICCLYSVTDEVHQTFVEGRSGKATDCLIDTTGALLGGSIIYFWETSKKKIVKQDNL